MVAAAAAKASSFSDTMSWASRCAATPPLARWNSRNPITNCDSTSSIAESWNVGCQCFVLGIGFDLAMRAPEPLSAARLGTRIAARENRARPAHEKSRRPNVEARVRRLKNISGSDALPGMTAEAALRCLDGSDLAALAAFDDGHSHALAFGKVAHPGPFKHGAVDEQVLGLALDRDEAEALDGIVPLHGAGRIRRTGGSALELWARREAAPTITTIAEAAGATRSTRWPACAEPTRATGAATPSRRIGRARVDADDFSDLR